MKPIEANYIMEINKNNDLSAFKYHPCKAHGKTPLTPNGCKDASNDAQVIAQWKLQYPDCNWGIATGTVSGVFVLDVDINHSIGKYGDISLEELEKSHGKLPETATVLTGGGGKHLYFKMPQGVEIPCSAGKLGANLDLRSDGGYVISESSTHENGRTYEWEDGFDPIEDEMEFSDAPDWLINLIKRSDRAIMAQSSSGYQYESSEWDCMGNIQRGDFMDALRHCQNDLRDDWIKIGMAIHSMDSTQVGFDLWQAWSMTSDKFDAQDQARVWFSFHNKENKRNKETVFYTARENGWQSEVKKQELAVVEAKGNAITDDINNPLKHDPQEAPKVEPIDYDFPVDCTLLNRLSGFICDATDYNVKAATTQAVIALAALIASRRFTTPTGDSCNLYVGILGSKSGGQGEIRYTSELAAAILKRCDLHKMIHEGRFNSRSQIYRTLYKSPTSLYLCDDFSEMISTSTRQSSGVLSITLNTLTGLYNKGIEGLRFNSLEEAGLTKSDIRNGDDEYKPEIEHPCLSILSLMSNTQLASFTKSSEISRGSVEQFLFAICDEDDVQVNGEEKPIFVPEDVIDELYRIKGWNRVLKSRSFEEISNQFISHNIASTLTAVTFECDLAPYDKMIDEITMQKDYRKFNRSARKNMRRLMTVLAAFSNNGKHIATKSIMDWCAQYVVKNLQRLIDRINVASSDDGVLDVRKKIIEKIYLSGADGIAKSRLTDISSYGALSEEKRDQLLDQLAKDKIIVLNVTTKQISGRSRKRIVHSKYIAKPTTENDDE
jgi:hypothetical protein